jgi:hypothetical protein
MGIFITFGILCLFIYAFNDSFISKYLCLFILVLILDLYIYNNWHFPAFIIGVVSLIILSLVWDENKELQKKINDLKDEINKTLEETNGIRDKND